MGQPLRRHLDRQSIRVSVICLLGAVLGLVLLLRDFSIESGSGGTKLANLTVAESRVRRKPASSFIWSNASGGASLYRKDYVQTGPDSSAQITMLDGTRIQIGENSLVVIDDIEHLQLAFMEGAGHGSVVIQKATGENVRIEKAVDGTAKIETLPAGETLPETTLTVPDLKFEALQRTADQVVQIHWSVVYEADSYEVLIANRAGHVTGKATIATTRFEGTVPFGMHFVKVRARRGDKFSDFSQPSALFHLPKSLRAHWIETEFGVKLLWTAVPGIARFKVEVKKESVTPYSQEVQGTDADLGKLSEGEYHWTITPILNGELLREAGDTGYDRVAPSSSGANKKQDGEEDENDYRSNRRRRGLIKNYLESR